MKLKVNLEGKAMPAYDTNNPFAKILRGEFPCYKVYEDRVRRAIRS